jgi:uncharacterized protein
VIVDTGVSYADIDRADDWHASAAQLLSIAPGPLRVPSLVVTEVCYLLEIRLGSVAEADFLAAFSRHDFDPIPLTSRDYERAAELVRKYADLPLSAVDASRARDQADKTIGARTPMSVSPTSRQGDQSLDIGEPAPRSPLG